ncbi:MAG TPA: toxin [Elusimicrobia bacterium]|nr:toxin [Elusimicrobiota bacterium]HBT62047.1 toxin [Elusimicrobiota bacterium]
MIIRWDSAKSAWLKSARGVSFEEILHEKLIAIEEHPMRPHQKLMLFERRGYIWVVPYVRTKDKIFLKTLFPSRAYTKKWIRGELR